MFVCRSNSLLTASLLTALLSLACLLALSAVLAAQAGVPTDRSLSAGWDAPVQLTAAPAPQLAQRALVPLPFALPAVSLTEITVADGAGGSGAADRQTEAAPVLSMAPHSEKSRYWISGQANSIFQMHGHFHSPYEGTNSLIDDFETKASEVATLYLGYQLFPNTRYNTDLIVDFENAGGRGISQALGLAGETNLDVVRNPNLSTAPYLARGEIHQIFGLTDEMTDQERGPFALATRVPVRRFEIRVGKMTLPDTFDVNSVGSDSHLQFTNWTIDNNGAWDYAADTRGYTVAGILEYDDRIWSARYAIAAMPTVANGINLDWAFSRASGQNWEFELRKGLFAPLAEPETRGRGSRAELREPCAHGRLPRVGAAISVRQGDHARHNANRTLWRSEVRLWPEHRAGSDRQPAVIWALRLERGSARVVRIYRGGQTILFGGDYAGQSWHRANDKVGVAFVSNAIKRDHQNYLHYGGLGFLLGDGNLSYGREDIVEWYYNAHIWRGFYGMIGGTYIDHPGYNPTAARCM